MQDEGGKRDDRGMTEGGSIEVEWMVRKEKRDHVGGRKRKRKENA